MSIPFRHSAAFGKRIEFYVVGLMLKEGLDVYLPLVDDHAVDAIVKLPKGRFVEVQIKARSKTSKVGHAAQFAALTHELRPNYWFVFYSERLDMMWILSSQEFVKESNQAKGGKNVGSRKIKFASGRKDGTEHPRPRFQKYEATSFARILTDNPA